MGLRIVLVEQRAFNTAIKNESLMMIQENRAVAVMDILGFKTFLEEDYYIQDLTFLKDKLTHIAKVYTSALDITNEIYESRSNSTYPIIQHIFSDSIILISSDNSNASIEKFILHVQTMLLFFLFHSLPLRGGISFGEMCINPNNNLFIGNPIVNAHTLEAQQEWIGIACDKKFAERYENLLKEQKDKFPPMKLPLIKYAVPCKNIKNTRKNNFLTKEMYVVDWSNHQNFYLSDWFDFYIKHYKEDFTLKNKCHNEKEKIRIKYENFLKFLKERIDSKTFKTHTEYRLGFLSEHDYQNHLNKIEEIKNLDFKNAR